MYAVETIWINWAGFAFLVILSFYVLSYLFRGWRQDALVKESFRSEGARLRAQIDRLMAEERFVQQQKELSWSGWRKFEVKKKNPEGGDICSFYLSPHDGRPLPPFNPGQFLTFQLHVPGQSKPIIRCYSLSDSPHHEDYYRVSIKRVPPPRDKPDVPPGLSSNHFHDNVNEGDILDVKAPGGAFFLDMSKSSPVVLIGGGVGLTPVLSMVNAITEVGSQRETHFFYGLRNSREHVFKEHLEEIDRNFENVHMHICYSKPLETDVAGKDFQHEGRVGADLFKEVLPSNNYDYYMCGPPPMMTTVTEGLDEWGVPEKNVHFEAFGPASAKKKAPAKDAPAAAAGPAITVNFAKSGKSLPWNADVGALLDFAEDNGVDIEFGCRAGNCGTCITAIKSGDVDYLNDPGEPPEAGSCLACIAVPKSDLTLDA